MSIGLQIEQHRERKEDRKSREHRFAWPAVLEVDIGKHRAQHTGHGHGDDVVQGDDVGRQGEGGEGACDDGSGSNMRGEVRHEILPRVAGGPRSPSKHPIRAKRGSPLRAIQCGKGGSNLS